MRVLPSLDAHSHIDPVRTAEEVANSGMVLAMTLSLDEAVRVANRREPNVVWGVGCHPRKAKSQEAFDADLFRKLIQQTALVGEIGLDTGSRVPLETQTRIFREELEAVAGLPRLVSIHAYRATGLVIRELKQRPVSVPILHWWTGTVEETREAVKLGCYFSVHSAVARHSKFHTAISRERLLIESDHGYADPPAAIPCRIEWVEHLLTNQLKTDVDSVRRLVWRNFASIVHKTCTYELLPGAFTDAIDEVGKS